MNIGITYDEKILDLRIFDEWLEIIAENGATFIEMSPHVSVLDLEYYQKIANKASNLSVETHFHAPYFADPHGFELKWNLLLKERVLDNHIKLFNWVQEIKQNNTLSYIILHGTPFESKKNKAIEATMRYLDLFLNHIEKNHLNITLLIETLSIEDGLCIGNEWQDIYTLINTFKTDHLKICWDMCHDLRNHQFEVNHINTIDFEQVPYAHIHGYNSENKKSHYSFKKQTDLYKKVLTLSKSLGFNGLLNIETLMSPCGENYEADTLHDLKWLRNHY